MKRWKKRKTKGKTTYHFRQAIEETIENANRYGAFLISKFKDEVYSFECKKTETQKIINEISKATKNVATAKFGKHQATWTRKLRILKEESSSWSATTERTGMISCCKIYQDEWHELQDVHG